MKLTSNNVWFTSDTHYGHSNIVKGVTNWRNAEGEVPIEQVRDFSSVETMNELMVSNINQHVQASDWLIHLGDWSFGGYDKIEEFREQINCNNVVLILGNHDHHIQRDIPKFRKMFNHITHYEELKITRGNDTNNMLILCHYPIISWNQMHHGSFMLHGHQHLKGEKIFGHGKRMDIGMCGSEEFRPYHMEEIVDLLKNRQFEPYIEHDRHTTKII
jgi:calcineurin-like phosphoesterase family protein